MEEQDSFLKYIYHEDLYIIDEPVSAQVSKEDESKNQSFDLSEENKSSVEDPAPVTYLGNNDEGILILVEDDADELLNQNDLDLLMKIVESGLKYTRNDFALVNTAKFPVKQVLEEISYSYLISFGVDLSDLFSQSALYTVHEEDNSKLLFSETLASMQHDDQKKKKLWIALKSMFNI